MERYYKGDDIDLEFELFEDDAKTQPWDLSNYEIRFELFCVGGTNIRKATSNVNGGSDEQIILGSSTNEFTVFIENTESQELQTGTHDFEIEIIEITTKKVTTIAYDKIEILEDRIKWTSVNEE